MVAKPRFDNDLTQDGSNFLSTGILCEISPGKKGPAMARAVEAYIPAAKIPELRKNNRLCKMASFKTKVSRNFLAIHLLFYTSFYAMRDNALINHLHQNRVLGLLKWYEYGWHYFVSYQIQ